MAEKKTPEDVDEKYWMEVIRQVRKKDEFELKLYGIFEASLQAKSDIEAKKQELAELEKALEKEKANHDVHVASMQKEAENTRVHLQGVHDRKTTEFTKDIATQEAKKKKIDSEIAEAAKQLNQLRTERDELIETIKAGREQAEVEAKRFAQEAAKAKQAHEQELAALRQSISQLRAGVQRLSSAL